MKRTIYVKSNSEYEAVAVLEDEVLVEYMQRKNGTVDRGTVLIVKIKDFSPSLEAYFGETGTENPGYLPVGFTDKKLKPGTSLPLQVVKPETGKKGMTLSALFSVTGKYCVISHDSGICRVSKKIHGAEKRERLLAIAEKHKPDSRGIIIRTDAADVSDNALIYDIEKTNLLYEDVKSATGKTGEIIMKPESLAESAMRNFNTAEDIVYFDNKELFDMYFREFAVPGKPSPVKYYDKEYDIFAFFSVINKIEEAGRRKVRLKSGGTLVFDYTEAMCVVDVNTAANTGQKNFIESAYKTNIEAAREIAVQLRLRNIGGIIVIDFIDMDKEKNDELDRQFRKFLSKDNKKMTIGGFTALGNYELTRMRKGRRLEFQYE